MQKITSRDNKLIKSAKKLLIDKKYRDVTNLFIAETYRVIKSLFNNQILIRNLIVSNKSRYFSFAKELDEKQIDVSIVSDDIFNSISNLANSDGLIAICVKPKIQLNIVENGKYIVLDKIQNPGNLGTIIRTAVGFGLNGVVITNDSVDLYHPNIIRSTMGSLFNIPIKVTTSLKDVILNFKKHHITTYATTLSKHAKSLNDIKFVPSSAIVLGNEGNGLNNDDVKLCDEEIYILITKSIDSLNVSVAAAIVMYKLVN